MNDSIFFPAGLILFSGQVLQHIFFFTKTFLNERKDILYNRSV